MTEWGQEGGRVYVSLSLPPVEEWLTAKAPGLTRRMTPQKTSPELYVQQNQPDGVPPLELTGERTLPDVPEENYWYQRHLVVYEWLRDRVGGLKVIDMASGEGYGAVLKFLDRYLKS